MTPVVAATFAFALGALLPLNAMALAIVLDAVWRATDD